MSFRTRGTFAALLLAAAPALLHAQQSAAPLPPLIAVPGSVNQDGDFQVGALSAGDSELADELVIRPMLGPGDPGTAVPEPATMALTGLGLLALGVIGRRRRRA